MALAEDPPDRRGPPLITGDALAVWPRLVHLLYPALLALAAFWLAHRRSSRRLFD